MDKQAWKVLKRLYPDSTQLEAGGKAGVHGCLMCAAEAETAKKAVADKKEEEKANRKKPLSCPLVRGFYTRSSYPIELPRPCAAGAFRQQPGHRHVCSHAIEDHLPTQAGRILRPPALVVSPLAKVHQDWRGRPHPGTRFQRGALRRAFSAIGSSSPGIFPAGRDFDTAGGKQQCSNFCRGCCCCSGFSKCPGSQEGR